MTTIFFDKDKYSLNITDSNLEGYIHILPLKGLILLMGEEGLELTVLDKERRFLYTFTEGQVTLEGVNLLGDIMGYHVALGNESNINQSIVQDTLTYIGFEYLYSFEGNLYLYYGENFNVLPTLIPTGSSYAAGDLITIDEGKISFGGVSGVDVMAISTYKDGNDQVVISRKFGTTSDETSVVFTEDSVETFNTVVATESNTFNVSVTRTTTDLLDVGSLEVTADGINVNISSEINETSNSFSITPVGVMISAYPNTRNDFPTDSPINLLCTNEDGTIQSYNTGVNVTITIPGVGKLRFTNGILVEYST